MTPFALALLLASSAPTSAGSRAELSAFSARDLQGQRVRLDELRGQVVVIAFWATWCAPCLLELQHLDALQRRHGSEGLRVLAVAGDGPETAARVGSVARLKRWQLTVIHDADRRLFSRFNPSGETPSLLVIDRRGRVAATHHGYGAGDDAALTRLVASVLGEP